MSLSIIIPVYNEEKTIRACLERVFALEVQPDEVIVVDANSSDRTLSIASDFDCKIIQSPQKGRPYQLDYAAREAQSEMLCFLHADTIPHPRTVSVIEKALDKPGVVLGGFTSIMRGKKTRRFISFHNYIKSYYAPFFYNPYKTVFKGLKLLFGDQVMFCKKEDYILSGGFDLEEEVMEEAAFCLRMNKLGKIAQLNEKVYSSDRRVVEWGPVKAHFLYIIICSGWGWGVSSKKLAKLYPDVR